MDADSRKSAQRHEAGDTLISQVHSEANHVRSADYLPLILCSNY